jgi:hypothetical protein
MPRRRRRGRILGTAILVVILGLSSRGSPVSLPWLVRVYAGDTLWALAAYLGFLFLWPSLSKWTAATLALAFSFLIELSQLYHAPWIDSLRANRLGGLILGFGFLWSDLICYGVGVSLGILLDEALRD